MKLELTKQARIAFHLSLWSFAIFAAFLIVFYSIVFVCHLLNGCIRAGIGHIVEPIGIFILQAIPSPALIAPFLASLFGIIMGYGIMQRGVDPKTTKMAARAVVFGFASLAVYAYLLLIRSGIGR